MLIRPLEEKVEKLAGFKVDLCIKIDQVHIELKKLKKGKVTNAVYVCVCLEEVIVTTAISKIMTALSVRMCMRVPTKAYGSARYTEIWKICTAA